MEYIYKIKCPPENNILWADVQKADQNAAWQNVNAFLLIYPLSFYIKFRLKNLNVECHVGFIFSPCSHDKLPSCVALLLHFTFHSLILSSK